MLNDDYIKRSDALKAIRAVPTGNWSRARYVDTVDRVPAADVEPVRRGRWVKTIGMMPPEFHGHYSCSECGWHGKNFEKELQFRRCPECGAKMDKEADDV